MSVVDDVRHIGVVPAERRPVRALALLGLSRVVLGLLLGGIVWAASEMWSVAGEAPDERPLVLAGPTAVAMTGTSVSGMLDDVRTRVERQGGMLVELDMTRRDGPDAAVRLTVDLPGTGAAAVERLVASLAASALDAASPRAVDPVPSGLRVSVDATVELAAALAGTAEPDARPAAVALADAAERSGVDLRGVGIPARAQDPVRLVASGSIAAVVDLLDIVEQEYGAPQRFRSVTLRRTAPGEYETVLTFGLREDVVRDAVVHGAAEGPR